MKSDKCPKDMSRRKTKSAPEFFLHHSAGKQSRILAKCLIGEKLRNGRSQDLNLEFQVI